MPTWHPKKLVSPPTRVLSPAANPRTLPAGSASADESDARPRRLQRPQRRQRALAAWALAWLVALTGCGDDTTQLVVAVDTDLAIPVELDEVFVEVTGPDGGVQRESQALSDRSLLPLAVGVTPSGAFLGPIDVAAVGRAGGVEVVRQSARVTLERGRSLFLPLFLGRACRMVSCEDATTCSEGSCVPRLREDLDEWTGRPTRPDGSVSDGGVGDGDVADGAASDGSAAMCVGDAQCPTGSVCCAGACRFVGSDVEHCGACNNACPRPAEAAATCDRGECGYACDPGCEETESGICACVTRPPRPIGPPSGAFVTTARPSLWWELPEGSVGARVELCRDRDMLVGCTTFDAEGGSGRAPDALTTGFWCWRAWARRRDSMGDEASPTWCFRRPARVGEVDSWWGQSLDTDLDGTNDLLIGAPSAGAAWARSYRGGYEVVELDVANPDHSAIGHSVRCAGDFNADGFPDAAVLSEGDRGLAFVQLLLGRASGRPVSVTSGLTLSTDWTLLSRNASLFGAGDLDRDGFSDLVIGLPLSGDGQGDFLIAFGAPGASFNTRTRPRHPGTIPNARLGRAVLGGIDSDGDGIGEVLVGAPGIPVLGGGAPAAFLYEAEGETLGRPVALLGPPESSAGVGASLQRADFDGDGLTDLVVAAPGANQVRLYRGSRVGVSGDPTQLLRARGVVLFGRSLGVGDFDGDGLVDLAVGALSTDDPPVGRVYLFAGSTGAQPLLPVDGFLSAPTGGNLFGVALAEFAHLRERAFDEENHDLVIGDPATDIVYWAPTEAGFPTTDDLVPLEYSGLSGGSFGVALP